LLRAKRKNEEAQLSVDPKRVKTINLYTKERRKTPCRLPKPEPNAEYQWGQARLVGTGDADGGGQPPASCLSPLASKNKEATGPNP
jgi:hypothetical protein